MRTLRRDLQTSKPAPPIGNRLRNGLLALSSLSLAFQPGSTFGEMASTAPPAQSLLAVSPADIRVDLFFNGAKLQVLGTIPAGHQAAVLCVGNEGRLDLKRKGRVWGLFWMNTADLVVDHVPSLYVLSTSAPLAQLAPVEVLTRLGVGYDGLEGRTVRKGSLGDSHATFRELVRLKTHEELFSVSEGTAVLERGVPGRLEVSAELFLPPRTPPGSYQVRLFSFHNGEGDVVGEATARLRQVGFAAFISKIAHERGLLYGIASVLIAIAAGMLTGVAFGRGSKRRG
jgi:uncharacterized protein (TIGR02186 family)